VTGRATERFVAGLLAGQPTGRARPDDDEAAQMAAAIEVRAGRPGSDSPRDDFVATLQRRLAIELDDAPHGTRRRVVLGTSVAAAAAGVVVGRNLLAPRAATPAPQQAELEPNAGIWRGIGAFDELADGAARAFDLGSVNGFVHRRGAEVRAVSGVCTHQGCKLWLDAPDQRLRCPCHSTSFALDGQTVSHQLPVAPAPLPTFATRVSDGVIEILAPPD
jgi:nitrite reductase/ring-hydroxylating ferredoxin subunit